MGGEGVCFSPKVVRLGYCGLRYDGGHVFGLLPHGGSSATAEQKEASYRNGDKMGGSC